MRRELYRPKPGDMVRWCGLHGTFFGNTGIVIATGLDNTCFVIWNGVMTYEREVNEDLVVCEVDP